MGLHDAPLFFQYLVEYLLSKSCFVWVRAFVDDMNVGGTTWHQAWEDTLQLIGIMAEAGFKFNLKNCKLVAPRCVILGSELFDNSN